MTTYLNPENAQPTVFNRFTLFACCLRHYRYGECPYIPPKPVAQPFHDIFLFLYFPILQFLFPHYSRIIFFIFFLHKIPYYPSRTIYFPMYLPHFPRTVAVIPYIYYIDSPKNTTCSEYHYQQFLNACRICPF